MQNETPPPKQRRRRVWLAVAAPLVVVAAVAFVFLVTRPLGGEPQPSFFVIGSAVPGVQIGQIAPGTLEAPLSPQLSLTDLGGAPVELRDFAGRPLWIIFWKTACEPCEAEAADVAAAYAAHRLDRLVILAVDAWDSPAVVQDYTEGHAPEYPIAIDTSAAFMDAFGVWGAPTHYFIGSDGIIRDRYFGPMTRDLIDESLRKITSP
jgi:peroxiredoxin